MIAPAACVNVLFELSLIKIKGHSALKVSLYERELSSGHLRVLLIYSVDGLSLRQDDMLTFLKMSGTKTHHVMTYT